MKYTMEIGSGGMIYIQSFIKIGSGIQKLLLGEYMQTHKTHGQTCRQQVDVVRLLFFLNKENTLKTDIVTYFSRIITQLSDLLLCIIYDNTHCHYLSF
jgi:hypothetical protein